MRICINCNSVMGKSMTSCPVCCGKYVIGDTQAYTAKGCPIALVEQNLILFEGKVSIALSLANVTDETVTACAVRLKCFDSFGDEVDDTIIKYIDIYAGKNKVFGTEKVISPSNSETRKFKVIIEKVAYENGELWKSKAAQEWVADSAASSTAKEQPKPEAQEKEQSCFPSNYGIAVQRYNQGLCVFCGSEEIGGILTKKCKICGWAEIKGKDILSFEITDKQIKVARGSLAGAKILVHAASFVSVPPESIVGGAVMDRCRVAEAINELLVEMNVTDKKADVIVCIHATEITKRMFDEYSAVFADLGFKLKQLDTVNYCITRLILNSPKLKENTPFLCIQVDPDFVNINLFENEQVALSRYVKIDPSDYDNSSEYVSIAVFDNLFRMLQYIQQRPDLGQLKHILFYGDIPDFVTLAEAIGSFNVPTSVINTPPNIERKKQDIDFSLFANAVGAMCKWWG